jgi:hypothetical protein
LTLKETAAISAGANPETIDEGKNNLDLAIAGNLQAMNEDHNGRDMLEEHREESGIDQQSVSRAVRPSPSGVDRNEKKTPSRDPTMRYRMLFVRAEKKIPPSFRGAVWF